MEKITLSDLPLLLERQAGPCVSLYLNGGRSSPSERMIRYRKLLKQAERLLMAHRPPRAAERILSSLRFFSSLSSEMRDAPALGCFSSPEIHGFFPLQAPVPDLCVVASSFHVKPVLGHLSRSYRWGLCVLLPGEAVLFLGKGPGLEELERLPSPSAGAVDSWLARHTRGALKNVPLFLGVAPHGDANVSSSLRTEFEDLLAFPDMSQGLRQQELVAAAWPNVQPWISARNALLLQSLLQARERKVAVEGVEPVLGLLKESNLRTLAIRSDTLQRGCIDWSTHSVSKLEEGGSGFGDCILDDLAEEALRRGVHVIACGPGELPAHVQTIGSDRVWQG